jgi:hypothetical protein
MRETRTIASLSMTLSKLSETVASETELNLPLRHRIGESKTTKEAHTVSRHSALIRSDARHHVHTHLSPLVELLGDAEIRLKKSREETSDSSAGTARNASNMPGGGSGAL